MITKVNDQKYHTTKDGEIINLLDLETSHLKNIIQYIKRKSVDGLRTWEGGCGSVAEDMWCEEETLFGDVVLEALGYRDYVAELNKRITLTK